MTIDYRQIINAITTRFNILFQQDDKPYTDYQLKVGNEQYFIENPLEKNEIGVAVHFGEGSVDYEQIILPVVLECIGLENEIDITQQMLTDFAIENNNTTVDGVKMFFNSPSKQQNFIDYGSSIRSLWLLNASFNVSVNKADIEFTYNYGTAQTESVQYQQIVADYSNSPIPEATSNSNGVNITTNQAQTRTITLVLSAKNNSQFLYDCFYYHTTGLNHAFNFTLTYNLLNNLTITDNYKLVDLKAEKQIASNLSITLVFSK